MAAIQKISFHSKQLKLDAQIKYRPRVNSYDKYGFYVEVPPDFVHIDSVQEVRIAGKNKQVIFCETPELVEEAFKEACQKYLSSKQEEKKVIVIGFKVEQELRSGNFHYYADTSPPLEIEYSITKAMQTKFAGTVQGDSSWSRDKNLYYKIDNKDKKEGSEMRLRDEFCIVPYSDKVWNELLKEQKRIKDAAISFKKKILKLKGLSHP